MKAFYIRLSEISRDLATRLRRAERLSKDKRHKAVLSAWDANFAALLVVNVDVANALDGCGNSGGSQRSNAYEQPQPREDGGRMSYYGQESDDGYLAEDSRFDPWTTGY